MNESSTQEEQAPGADPLGMPVGRIATQGVIGCRPGETLLDAAGLLSGHSVHALVVEPLEPPARPGAAAFSVLTDQDLLEVVAAGRDLGEQEAAAVAGTEPVAIDASATVREAAVKMREHDVSHLFVLHPSSGRPLGVVSSLDIARVVVQSAPASKRAVRLVLGHDAGPGGDDATALASLLAGADGEVHAMMAVPYPPRSIGDPPIKADPGPGNWEQISEQLRAKGAEVLERRALAAIATAHRHGDVVIDNSASAALSAAVETERPDFVVVGSSRYGRLGKVLLGSSGEQLAHGAASPVAIAPRGYAGSAPQRITTIAVGFDGRSESVHALELAARLARRHGARLRVIGVLETTVSEGEIISEAVEALSGKPVTDRRKHELEGAIAEGVAAHADGLEVSSEIERGRVADRLIDACRQDTELLVVGSRGYGPLARVLLGSTSTRLAREAPCPLVIATRSSYRN